MFTTDSTYREMTENPGVMKYLGLFIPPIFTKIVGEELWDFTFNELRSKLTMPWGAPFLAEMYVEAANISLNVSRGKDWQIIPIWNEGLFDGPYEEGTKENVCLITSYEKFEKKCPAVIIAPGGGYRVVSTTLEGLPYAEVLEKAGFKAFSVNYRVAPNCYPSPQKDLALAIKYVKANAEKWNIDPENIITIGSSAGGHLCASHALYSSKIDELLSEELSKDCPALAKKYSGISSRPVKAGLAYPVINFISEMHEESAELLTGGDESLREILSVDLHVDETYPETFIWNCEDDPTVPASNGRRMYDALQKAGVRSEYHRYPTGGHGIGLAKGTSAEGWMEKFINFIR